MENKKYMVFETKKNGKVEMAKDTFARWLCLMEAFHIIDKKAEDLGLDMKDEDWVKPLAFEKYVDQRFEGMMLDLAQDEKNNLVGNNFVHYTHSPESQESVVSTVG
jgi:hypothetical protein